MFMIEQAEIKDFFYQDIEHFGMYRVGPFLVKMNFILKYKYISIMSITTETKGESPMLNLKEVITNFLTQNYGEWRVNAPLPPVMLCMCMEYIISEEKEYENSGDRLSSHVFCVDGKRHGLCKTWYQNGDIREESFYVKGILHGEYKLWNFIVTMGNRELSLRGFFVHGKREGEWYKLGIDSYARENYVHELLHGESRHWHSNGQLWVHEHYENGELHGECKVWSRSGLLLEHKNYVQGKIHGHCMMTVHDKQIWANYKNGDRHGKCNTYNSNGVLLDQRNYVYGMMHGECKVLNPDNITWHNYVYEHGTLL